MNSVDPAAHVAYKAGYRRFTWRDPDRNRPVWADVWFPSTDAVEEFQAIEGARQLLQRLEEQAT